MTTRARTGAVVVGAALEELHIPITTALVVGGAIATRDFEDVHHDPRAARLKGTPDVFMNILTTTGLVGRFITDWAGPAARLRRVALRLGAPNHPGDTMVLRGSVTAVDGGRVEVAVVGANGLGDHVRATVVVDLEQPGATP
jgi:hypothetical protein